MLLTPKTHIGKPPRQQSRTAPQYANQLAYPRRRLQYIDRE
jgi:hypothetical protein